MKKAVFVLVVLLCAGSGCIAYEERDMFLSVDGSLSGVVFDEVARDYIEWLGEKGRSAGAETFEEWKSNCGEEVVFIDAYGGEIFLGVDKLRDGNDFELRSAGKDKLLKTDDDFIRQYKKEGMP